MRFYMDEHLYNMSEIIEKDMLQATFKAIVNKRLFFKVKSVCLICQKVYLNKYY